VTEVIYDTKKKDCNRDCYVQEMAESVFCMNPLGRAVQVDPIKPTSKAPETKRLKL